MCRLRTVAKQCRIGSSQLRCDLQILRGLIGAIWGFAVLSAWLPKAFECEACLSIASSNAAQCWASGEIHQSVFLVWRCAVWLLSPKQKTAEWANEYMTDTSSLPHESKQQEGEIVGLTMLPSIYFTIPPSLSLSLSSCPADRWRYLGVAMNN